MSKDSYESAILRLLLVILSSFLWNARAQITPNAVVAQDGSGNYATISDAISAVPSSSTQRYYIWIKEGIYNENIVVEDHKTNLTFIGDGIDKTVITGDKNSDTGLETHDTATAVILGDGFAAQGITFQNTAGPDKQQAVALLVESDNSAFYRCKIAAYQDTLYAKHGNQFFRDCEISGTVDIIFGNAKVVIQNCNIYARKPVEGQVNTIVAQGRRSYSEDSGTVIQNSIITAAPDLHTAEYPVKTYLGRPWKEYSTTVIIDCYLDAVIDPEGWKAWDENSANLDTIYYVEYGNVGPGSDTSRRVNWKGFRVLQDPAEAAQFTVWKFIQGDSWIPAIGIPFYSGLYEQPQVLYSIPNRAQGPFSHALMLMALVFCYLLIEE